MSKLLISFIFVAFVAPCLARAERFEFDCPKEPNSRARDTGKLHGISVFHLIARPELYEGKTATVVGVLRVESTKLYLYPSIDSANHALVSMAVELRKPTCTDYGKWLALKKFDGTYVSVSGVYSSEGYGSVEAGGGEMTEISKVGSYN